jgi:hypothetical protein
MIHETGFWQASIATPWHYHSQNVNDWIISFLSDKKETQIYDFGCGMGDYLYNLHKNGFKNIIGFEADPPKFYEDFEIKKQNLAEPFRLDKKGIIISLEVGEHIPEKYEDIFLTNLYENCSDYLIISWAVRGQGGHGHFNELNNDEIIPKIESLGFEYLVNESESARKVPEDACWYFRNTLMIFKKI